MRRMFMLITCVTLLTAAVPAAAYVDTFTTGKEWSESMTDQEKLMAVIAPMIVLDQYGVPFRKPPQEYVPQIDEVLENNPYLENEDVANIFASTVYTYEPESRRMFDMLESVFRTKTKYYDKGFSPYLIARKTDQGFQGPEEE